MILKGSQRGGPRQLAVHLMNTKDNDHVSIPELKGFVSEDLLGAMAETEAVAKGTKCRQAIFSLSINPPKGANVTTEDLMAAADRAEQAVGLTDYPRAVVIHEKNGRKHAHVVWSRIDSEKMTAANIPYYKFKLASLSKQLYLEHGWELPDGYKTNGWKNPLNFTLAEWQQAKRLDLDPREIKQVFQSAWQRSDNLASLRQALEDSGYYLAKGDRRKIVAVDLNGDVFSVSRLSNSIAKEVEANVGNGAELPSVADVRKTISSDKLSRVRTTLEADREAKNAQLKPLLDEAKRVAASHRAERAMLQRKQDERRVSENKTRSARFSRGLGAVLDLLTGRLFTQRRQNEREAYQGFIRDRSQREQLFSTQLKEREALQIRIDSMKARHSKERAQLTQRIAQVLQAAPAMESEFEQQQLMKLPGIDFDM